MDRPRRWGRVEYGTTVKWSGGGAYHPHSPTAAKTVMKRYIRKHLAGTCRRPVRERSHFFQSNNRNLTRERSENSQFLSVFLLVSTKCNLSSTYNLNALKDIVRVKLSDLLLTSIHISAETRYSLVGINMSVLNLNLKFKGTSHAHGPWHGVPCLGPICSRDSYTVLFIVLRLDGPPCLKIALSPKG